MDRKTVLAFVLIAVVLILTPWYMDLVAPQRVAINEFEAPENPPASDEVQPTVSEPSLPLNQGTDETENLSINVENQLYESTGSAETMSLVVNNSDADNILFFHGDLYFGQNLIDNLDYSKSFVLASSSMMNDREVGVTRVKNKATIFSHGLDLKWCQIVYLCGKELKLLRQLFRHLLRQLLRQQFSAVEK